jgi:prephenate dehydrogenase
MYNIMNKTPQQYTIGIVGLGLIGGSLAKAFQNSGYSVVAVDINAEVIKSAIHNGTIDKGSVHADVLSVADIIFVALYPADAVAFIKNHCSNIKKDCIVIDCCGVKEFVCTELSSIALRHDFIFIGGHPMAGTEKSGFEASTASLFENASFILTPQDGTPHSAVDNASGIIMSAGFSRVVLSTPRNHDKMIAFTSQLPHVIACAYVKSPACPEHKGFSSGSFRDVSRVAHLNANMWAQLFLDNKEQLLSEIDTFTANLTELRNAVACGDFEQLESLLQAACTIKDRV